MPINNHIIDEWKERHEEYRHYCSLYLNVLSFAMTATALGLGFALQKDTDHISKIVIVLLVDMVNLFLCIAHIVAEPAVKELSARIMKLESTLGFGANQTVRPLLRGLRVTFYGSLFGFIIVTLLLIFVIRRVII